MKYGENNNVKNQKLHRQAPRTHPVPADPSCGDGGTPGDVRLAPRRSQPGRGVHRLRRLVAAALRHRPQGLHPARPARSLGQRSKRALRLPFHAVHRPVRAQRFFGQDRKPAVFARHRGRGVLRRQAVEGHKDRLHRNGSRRSSAVEHHARALGTRVEPLPCHVHARDLDAAQGDRQAALPLSRGGHPRALALLLRLGLSCDNAVLAGLLHLLHRQKARAAQAAHLRRADIHSIVDTHLPVHDSQRVRA